MADRYAASGTQDTTTSTPGDSTLGLQSSTTNRPRLYDIICGTKGTPADNALDWQVSRFTAAGTGTAVTEVALDPGAPTQAAAALENHTVEPTYTADNQLLDFGLNQRATFRWVAAPDGELVLPATAANGIGIVAFHASYTGETDATFHWYE